MACMRFDIREILRAAMLRWNTPRAAARIKFDSATRNASSADSLEPSLIAVSTRTRKLRARPRNLRLRSVRRLILRIILRADFVFAMVPL